MSRRRDPQPRPPETFAGLAAGMRAVAVALLALALALGVWTGALWVARWSAVTPWEAGP